MKKIILSLLMLMSFTYLSAQNLSSPQESYTEESEDSFDDYDVDNNSSIEKKSSANTGVNHEVHIKGERTESDPKVRKYTVTPQKMPYILSTPYVDTTYKIYDFADVLTQEQEDKITKRCHEFVQTTGLDIAIVTLNYVNHQSYGQWTSYETYIQDFYDYNDFGKDEKFSGVMLLLDLQHGKNSIFDAGKPFEQSFMAYQLEYYGPEMRPLFDRQQYFDEIMWFIENTESDWCYDQSFPFWKCLIFGSLIAMIIFFAHKSRYKLVFKMTSANSYKVKDSFNLTQNTTTFVKTFTTRTYSPRSSSSGGSSGSGSSGGGHSGGSF